MAYKVNHTDPNNGVITVNDGTLNTSTSLTLVGKNFYGYGEHIAENQLGLLENWAGPTAPANPVQGQHWYDNDGMDMKYWDGTQWVASPHYIISQEVITDANAVDYPVTKIKADTGNGNITVAVMSDVAFVTNANDPEFTGFNQIGVGITLAQGMKLHGTATTAEYADLAEMYTSDAAYEPGTVVKIGGEAEVTQTTDAFCPDVFGIVSTDPAYLMNSMTEGVAVALEGRVPCRVIGPVKKGQRLVSSETPGVARAVSEYERQEALDWYRIVGRALADKTTEGEGLLEVVVGAK